MKLKQLIAFSILMQNGKGIAEKSPAYIHEKFEMCSDIDNPRVLLDRHNQAIYDSYLEMWDKKGALK